MKKVLLIVLSLCLFLLAACSQSKTSNGNDFVGTWQSLDGQQKYIFKKDGDNFSLTRMGFVIGAATYDSSEDALKFTKAGTSFYLKIVNGEIFMADNKNLCNKNGKVDEECVKSYTYKKIANQ
jgi:hypothetical protein